MTHAIKNNLQSSIIESTDDVKLPIGDVRKITRSMTKDPAIRAYLLLNDTAYGKITDKEYLKMPEKNIMIQSDEREACLHVETLGRAIALFDGHIGDSPNSRLAHDLKKLKTKIEDSISDEVWQDYLHEK